MQSTEADLSKRFLVWRKGKDGAWTPVDSFATEAQAKLYAVLAIQGIYPGYRIEDTRS